MPSRTSRRASPRAAQAGVLARMRVGTKLLLLVLLPACALIAFASLVAIGHWRQAQRLSDFGAAARMSFRAEDAVEALANERTAAALDRLGARSPGSGGVAAAQRASDLALRRAAGEAAGRRWPVDVAARLQTARRQLDALRRQVAAGSLGLQLVIEDYGGIGRGLAGIVRDLDSARPSRDTGRAATAYVALGQAIEGAEMERVTVAAALVRGTAAVRVRGVVVEASALDDFRQYAAPRLVGQLNRVLAGPAGSTVTRVRDVLIRDPASLRSQLSAGRWQAASGTRIRALRRLEGETGGELAAAASADLDGARATANVAVAASLAVLLLLTGLGLVLRRSITQPLGEVTEGARRLSAGRLEAGVSYAGRDEIGEVAAAFRDLQVTAERVAHEIHAMNAAVDDNRLEHRADVGAFQGSWADLMGGVNDTMAAFGALQDRREQAERHADSVFELSHDLLCIAGFDGYFKRVNPAFERVLGYPTDVLLSRPTKEFIHPDDRRARDERHEKLHAQDAVVRYEQRQLCSDGSVRHVEWIARAVHEQQLVYGVGRDVTETRRAAADQAALRRVATLVAKSAEPEEIFAAVAREVRALLEAGAAGVVRCERDGSIAVLGAAPEGPDAGFEEVAAAVVAGGAAIRSEAGVGAPIVVEDRLWGVVAVTAGAESLPAGTEERLARFTDLVATAIANAEGRAEVAASRARVVAAGQEERQRVVRDLHDGAQQGLVHTIIALELAARAYEERGEPAPVLVAEALEHARRANDELRELSQGILPTVLTRGGLREGVEALVSRTPVAVVTHVSVGRLPSVVEATAYFVVAEALTNVVKHARAGHATVSADVEDGTLRVAVRDDGVGGARMDGSGLVGLRDRLEALDGRLRVESPPGSGTLVAAEIPLPGDRVAPGAGAATADAA